MMRLVRFVRLPARLQRLYLEAAFHLSMAGLTLLVLPFRRIAPRLGVVTHHADPPSAAGREQELEEIAWALHRAARVLPWRCTCLPKAIAGSRMLGRRGIPYALYLGAAREQDRELIAHAWLRCGDTIVTGGEEMAKFTIVSSFIHGGGGD